MCVFYSISTFRKELSALQSLKTREYSSVWDDIINEFNKKDISEIRNTVPLILLQGNIKLIKTRIPNSFLKYGKSNGYRLLYLVRMDREEVVFLFVYPKRGKKGINNVKDTLYIKLISTYIEETNNGSLLKI